MAWSAQSGADRACPLCPFEQTDVLDDGDCIVDLDAECLTITEA
jgi:hypothetical protein